MLVLGLGGTGSLVARRARSIFPDFVQKGNEVRVFDQGRDGQEKDRAELFLLPVEETRQMLRDSDLWHPCLKWLPAGQNFREIDEAFPDGAGGLRWFGRLSFFAADLGIQRTLRASLLRLRERTGTDLQRVGFVGSLAGGTGSGLLTDMTYLMARLAERAVRTAFLLIPELGTTDSPLSAASSYAALKELYLLKYQSIAFDATYPGLGERSLPAGTCEPWQRIYLFAPKEGEAPPYLETVNRMALALTAHFQGNPLGLAFRQAKLRTRILSRGDDAQERDRCFGACECASEVSEKAPGLNEQEGNMEEPAVHDMPPPAERSKEGADDAERLFEIYVGGAARMAAQQLADAFSDEIATLAARMRRLKSSDTGQLMARLVEIEGAVERVNRQGSEDQSVAAGDSELAAFGAAEEGLRAGVQEYLLKLPKDSKKAHTQRIEPRFLHKWEAFQGFVPAQRESYENLVKDWRGLVEGIKEIPIEARCGALRALVKSEEFQRRLRIYLLRAARRNENLDREEEPRVEAESSAAAATEAEAKKPTPAIETPGTWQERLECLFRGLQRNVFARAGRLHTLLAVARIPEAVLRVAGHHEVEMVLEKASWEALGCHCELVPTSEDRISIYYEDLFHSPCEIRHIDEWREAYLKEPHPERLHIDTRFLAPSRFDEICARKEPPSPLQCGNPGCDGDVADLPPEVQTCPKCGQPIRSRCGNEGCPARDLHLRTDGTARSCPECGGFNHAAWWLCCEHGKVPVWVPIDKCFCPKCIERHHEQPDSFPESSIGRRPQGQGGKECPNCRRLAETDPGHEVFRMPEDLIPFYERGVNGHDRKKIALLAEKHRLPDGYRCPTCRTSLIPVVEKQCPSPAIAEAEDVRQAGAS